MTLVGIGEFARLSRLSPKALRLYHELGLLPPARVDPDTGYRWYDPEQLERARLVAMLRQIRVPLAQATAILAAEPAAAAAQLGAYWAGAEADHLARRELAGYLVDRLHGKRTLMYDVATREIPARSMLCLLRHAHRDDLLAMGKQVVARLRPAALPRPGDPVSAPFVVYHGEVSEDGDGPVEWCWPVPDDRAAELAGRFPDLVLRTEPAHEEAYVHLGQTRLDGAQFLPVLEAIHAWVTERRRQPIGGIRQIMIRNPASADGPDGEYAVPLR